MAEAAKTLQMPERHVRLRAGLEREGGAAFTHGNRDRPRGYGRSAF